MGGCSFHKENKIASACFFGSYFSEEKVWSTGPGRCKVNTVVCGLFCLFDRTLGRHIKKGTVGAVSRHRKCRHDSLGDLGRSQLWCATEVGAA